MRRNSGFERHRADCGALIGKSRGKPGFWDAASGGPCGCFKWFSSDFEGLYLSIQCEGIRALSAIGRTAVRQLRRAGGSPAFGMLQAAGLAGVSSDFSSGFEGLHRSIQCEGIRVLSAIGRAAARHLGRAGGSPAFRDVTNGGPCGVFSSGFQVISRDCIAQSNAKGFGL